MITYDPGSRGAVSYLEAARELAERGAAKPPPERAVPEASAAAINESVQGEQGRETR